MSFSLVHYCSSPALQLSCPVTPVLNRIYLPVTCRSRSSRLPYSRNWYPGNAQRPTPCGQRHWRPRLMDTLTVTLRHPDCPAALRPQLREGLFSSHTRGWRGRKTEESGPSLTVTKFSATPSPVSLSSPLTNGTQVFINTLKLF